MIRRLWALLVVSVALAGGLLADDPDKASPRAGEKDPRGDDKPLELKRKKRAAPPMTEDMDPDKAPAPVKGKEKPIPSKEPPVARKDGPVKGKQKPLPGKTKPKKDDPLEPEDNVPAEKEDDQEVIERVSRTMRDVEEKLSNRELGEPTAQAQEDIIKDLDRLIRKSQNQQGGGADNKDQQDKKDQDKKDQDQKDQDQKGGKDRQEQGGMGEKKPQQQRGSMAQRQPKGGQKPGRKPRRQPRQLRGDRKPEQKMVAGNQQPMPQQNPMTGDGGEKPGAGKKSPESDKDINADLYKKIWGHLMTGERGDVNVYSKVDSLIPRYDDLIKKYYQMAAEQGRKKGE